MKLGKTGLGILALFMVITIILPGIYLAINNIAQDMKDSQLQARSIQHDVVNEKISIFYKYVFAPLIIILGTLGILLPTIEILNRTNKL